MKDRDIFITMGITIGMVLASLFIGLLSYFFLIALNNAYGQTYDYLVNPWAGSPRAMLIIWAIIMVIFLLHIWQIFKLKWRLIITFVLVTLLVANVAYDRYQKEVLQLTERTENGSDVDLYNYMPFIPRSLAASLDDASTLNLFLNLPRLDGATALYPLYAAFVQETYPKDDYIINREDSIVNCTKTSQAFDNLIGDKADMVFLMGVSEEQYARAQELGLELKLTPIGREAFIFFVSRKNSADGLTQENVKDIYSGRLTWWNKLGGGFRKILAYQRPETSGSQVMLKEIMGDTPIVEVPYEFKKASMMDIYEAVAYKNHKNALGYSFLFYIKDMINEEEIKFLSIDGVAPNSETIADGSYPYAHDFYAVTLVKETNTARDINTEKLLENMLLLTDLTDH